MNFRNFFPVLIFLLAFNRLEAKDNYCPYLIEENCSFSPGNNTNIGENYENGGSTFFSNPAIRAEIEQGLDNFNTTYTSALNLYCGRFFLSYESCWNWDTSMYSMVSPSLRKAYDNYNSKFPGTHNSKSVIEQFYPEYRQYVVRSDGKPGLLLLYLQCHYYDHGDTSKPLQQLNIFGLLSHGFNGDDNLRIEYLQSERCTDSIKSISSPDLKMKKYLEMVLREFSSPVQVLNEHCPDCPLHPIANQDYWDEDGRLWKWMQGADGNMKWLDLSYEFPEEGQNYDLSWKPSQENAVQNYHRELFVDKITYLRNDPLQRSLGGVPAALEKEIWRATQFAAVIAMKERHVSQQMNWWEGFIPVWGNARQGYYNFQIANGQLLFQVNGCVGVAMSALDLMLCDAFIQNGCIGVLRSPMNFVSKGLEFTISTGKSLVLFGKQSVVRLSLVLTLDRAPQNSMEFFNNRNLENAIEIFDNAGNKYIKYNPDDGKALVATYSEHLDGSTTLEFEKEVTVPKDAGASEEQMAEKVVGALETGEIPFINGWTKESILALPKGQRPDPSIYLEPTYITTQLNKFQSGASFLVPEEVLDNYGRNLLGRPDNTQFVMPSQELDNLLNRTGGNISQIETQLGIPAGTWANKQLVRIDIIHPQNLNLRIPNGNEMGANSEWIPGGKLPTGYSEGVVNQIPIGDYQEISIQIH